MTTLMYEENIMDLYFNGYYDFLDISRIMKIHPDELTDIMLSKGMILNKKYLGGYSAYKLFNDIDERLRLIEQKLNKDNNKLVDDEYSFNEEDILFDDDNSYEYSDIYDVLLDDDNSDSNDEQQYDSKYINEYIQCENEKNENGYIKFEGEKNDEDIVKMNKNTQTQNFFYEKNHKNNEHQASSLKNSMIKNLFFDVFGNEVLGNAIFFIGSFIQCLYFIIMVFHYCKNTFFH